MYLGQNRGQIDKECKGEKNGKVDKQTKKVEEKKLAKWTNKQRNKREKSWRYVPWVIPWTNRRGGIIPIYCRDKGHRPWWSPAKEIF